MATNFFSPFSFIAVFGSGMGKNQDPGSGINISDPQHCGMGKRSGSGIKKEIGSGMEKNRILRKTSRIGNTGYVP